MRECTDGGREPRERRRVGALSPAPPVPDSPARRGLPVEVGLSAVVLIWGLNFAVIKVPLAVMPPFTVNLFRFVVSVGVLGALHVADARRRGQSPFHSLRVAPWAVLGLGVMAHGVYQGGFILGIDRVTAGMGALLIATSPLWTALIGHALGIDRLRGASWLGVALGLAGAALVIVGRPESEAEASLSGVVFLLVGSVAWALYTVLSRPVFEKGVSPMGFTFWGVLAAMPVIAGLGLWEMGGTRWAEVGAPEWAAIAFSGGLSTGIAYGLWNAAVRRVGPTRTAMFSNLVPVVGVLAGAVLLKESVLPLQIAGGVLVIAGLVVMRRA